MMNIYLSLVFLGVTFLPIQSAPCIARQGNFLLRGACLPDFVCRERGGEVNDDCNERTVCCTDFNPVDCRSNGACRETCIRAEVEVSDRTCSDLVASVPASRRPSLKCCVPLAIPSPVIPTRRPTTAPSRCPCRCRFGSNRGRAARSECGRRILRRFCSVSRCEKQTSDRTRRGTYCCDKPTPSPYPTVCPCICRIGPSRFQAARRECSSSELSEDCNVTLCRQGSSNVGVSCCN